MGAAVTLLVVLYIFDVLIFIYGGISISVQASCQTPTRIDLVGVSAGMILIKDNVYEYESNRNKFSGFRI